MDSSQLDGLKWRRSSRCNGGQCVEVAQLGDEVMVRDSADPDWIIAVSNGNWQEFITDVRAGRLDLE